MIETASMMLRKIIGESNTKWVNKDIYKKFGLNIN